MVQARTPSIVSTAQAHATVVAPRTPPNSGDGPDAQVVEIPAPVTKEIEARTLLLDVIEASGTILEGEALARLETLAMRCETIADIAALHRNVDVEVEKAREFQVELACDRSRAVESLHNLDVVETINGSTSAETLELRRELEKVLTARQKITDELATSIDAQITSALRSLFDRDVSFLDGAAAIEIRTQYHSGRGVVTSITPSSLRRLSRAEHQRLDEEACRLTESLIAVYKKIDIEIDVRHESGVGVFEPPQRSATTANAVGTVDESQRRHRERDANVQRTHSRDTRAG